MERRQEELVSYVEEQYDQAVQQDAKEYIQGLLAAGNVDAKEIRVSTDRNEENSIVLTEVAVWCSYPSQEERARALLQNTLGEEVQVTVRTGG